MSSELLVKASTTLVRFPSTDRTPSPPKAGGLETLPQGQAQATIKDAYGTGDVEHHELQEAVDDLNEYVQQSLRRELKFSIDQESGRTVVKVVDPESGDTVRQIPSEEMLALNRSLGKHQGLIFNAKV
jgi:flagellar protein FlaG